ncbi:MAG TPA: S41 family peptidase [Pyrinomonadaceae bacterium]
MIEDVNFYVSTLEETHINPFVHISQEGWRAQAGDIKARIAQQGAMTQQEFWLLFAPLASLIQDRHTLVMEPRFFIPNNPTKYLPVRTVYVDGKLVVTSSVADVQITRGAIITSINAVESGEVVRKLSRYGNGVRKERLRGVGEWLWIGAAEVFGRPESFVLTFSDGTKAEVKGVTVSEIIKRERAAGVNPTQAGDSPLELKFLESGVAYLNSLTFSYDLEKYKSLLKGIFTRIKESGARDLIIDLRSNTGGHSALGDELLGMFNAKPYKGYTSSWKRSRQYVEYMRKEGVAIPDHYLDLKPAEVYVSKASTVRPAANPLRFGGRVYVLSGEETFSSGQMFLGVVKDNDLAEIIGEETSTPACFAGELYMFNLPNSRLRASSSVRYWVAPGGCKGARGVVPDIVVTRRLEDYLTGRDRILEEALKLAKRKQNSR